MGLANASASAESRVMIATPCLICGRPADSKEHYIPRWLSKASGRPNEVIIKGSTAGGVLQSAQAHGTAIEAFETNLCRDCNHTLGNTLESPISAILKPLIAGNFTVVKGLTDAQRLLLTWWSLLHALEHDFLENRLDQAPKQELLKLLGELVAGRRPLPPSDAHVHIAQADHAEYAFFLSKQLIDRTRGSVQAPGSFCWGMQAGHLILTAARMPSGARPAQGWGFSVWPAGAPDLPRHGDILDYYAGAKIETGLVQPAHPPRPRG